MTAAIIIPLARGCSSPPVGLSARGTDYLSGAPRCALASASLCQEAADYAAAVIEMHDRARTSSGRSVLGGSGGDRASSDLGPGRGLSMLPGDIHHAPFSRRTSHGRREPAGHTPTVLRASAVVPQHTGTGSHGGKGGVAGNAPHRPRVSTGMSRSRRALGQPSNEKAAVASGGRE